MRLQALILIISICGFESLLYKPACSPDRGAQDASNAARVLGSAAAASSSAAATLLLGAASDLPNPAARGSLAPNLTPAPGERSILSWLEPSDKGLALRFSIWDQHTWGGVGTVVRRSDFDKYAEAPATVLMLGDGSLIAVWGQEIPSSGKWPGSYLYAAASHDGGATWSAPTVVHSDRSISEHSFSSIVAIARDRAALIWLDARDYASKNRYRLMSATVDASGKVSGEQTIDDDVCTCCPTSLAATPKGLVAAYRDHTPREIRDIGIISQEEGRWGQPRILHRDGWHINGCPVNGPAVSSQGTDVAVAWFTAANGAPTVNLALSHDSGATFTKQVVLDSAASGRRPVGRAALVLLRGAGAVALWLRQDPGGAEIVFKALEAPPETDSAAPTVLARGKIDGLGYPRMQQVGAALVISWGGAGGDMKAVKTAAIPLVHE